MSEGEGAKLQIRNGYLMSGKIGLYHRSRNMRKPDILISVPSNLDKRVVKRPFTDDSYDILFDKVLMDTGGAVTLLPPEFRTALGLEEGKLQGYGSGLGGRFYHCTYDAELRVRIEGENGKAACASIPYINTFEFAVDIDGGIGFLPRLAEEFEDRFATSLYYSSDIRRYCSDLEKGVTMDLLKIFDTKGLNNEQCQFIRKYQRRFESVKRGTLVIDLLPHMILGWDVLSQFKVVLDEDYIELVERRKNKGKK
ncbi:MAG: hypothetical protein ACE5J7_03000 [Candidatus Aenigmatarchaeota archaeon]